MTYKHKPTFPASVSSIGFTRKRVFWSIAAAVSLLAAHGVQAQNYPITAQQRAIAQQAAARGVPVGELKADAPQTYTVKRGDTLWAIAGLYLHKPWRWPELWGLNLDTIKNPHLIYPGQTLYLSVHDGYARLGYGPSGEGSTVRLSPSVRSESLEAVALPTIRRDLIQPFLVRPVVKNEEELERLPVVLASTDERLVTGNGDTIYARGTDNVPLSTREGSARDFSIFRDAKPLRDPDTKEVLGFEGEYVGQARIVKDEYWQEGVDKKGRPTEEYVPAKLEISKSATEVRTGDRLNRISETADYANFVPRVPPQGVAGKVISLYSDLSVKNALSNQAVAINVGADQAIEPGHVFQILKSGRLARDPEGGVNARVRLPDEPNGYLLVFRVFDRVSYGLILDSHDGVGVGDKLVSPE